jgi:hypothetical protein
VSIPPDHPGAAPAVEATSRASPARGPIGPGIVRIVLPLALAATVIAALVRLGLSFLRLVRPWAGEGGWDLRLRMLEVKTWFAGMPVYGVIESADYPPASYPMLWPFVGWTNSLTARWIWAATTVAMLMWLGWTLARESPARTRKGLVWFALLPAASYATFVGVLTGQLTIHVLALLAAGTLVLVRGRTWSDDVLGSAAIVAALVKPTLSVPLVWIAFLAPRRLRPTLLIVAGYAALTLFAARFQSESLAGLLRGWLGQEAQISVMQSTVNLQRLLFMAGLNGWFLPAALGLLMATGYWVYRHRTVDVWLLLGVTALVARFWTYHRRFDDLLILFPMLALFRLAEASDQDESGRILPAMLGVLIGALLLAPVRLLLDNGFDTVLEAVQATSWLAALIVLMLAAAREQRAIAAGMPATPLNVAAARPPFLSSPTTERMRAWLAARSFWPRACFALPVVVLIAMYAWLAVDHGTLWLWNVTVHESGRYTFGATVLYFAHFLRELPTLIAMCLFVLAAYGLPSRGAGDSKAGGYAILALVAAGLLCVVAFTVSVGQHGADEAFRNLFQFHTRDDQTSFGSHWRYHWLSTVWFGVAIPLVARLGALWLGAPMPSPDRDRRPFVIAAWGWFALVTVTFGLSGAILSDALYVGHQAREIATHALITMPLALGIVAWVARRDRHAHAGIEDSGPASGEHARRTATDEGRVFGFAWYQFGLVLAIPLYFVLPIQYGDVMEAGQTRLGLASMVGAHVYEHSLDYLFVALILIGTYGLGSAIRRRPAR